MYETTNIFTKEKTISSLEVAEMMETEHWKVLRKIDGQEKDGKHIRGYSEILNDNEIVVDDYFIKSTYKDAKGEERPSYEITRLGCDFLANKFTGEKGILFTARYVKRFSEMENKVQREEGNRNRIEQTAFMVKFVADDMRINDASRLLMYENMCKDFGIPTGFLPKYERNGGRQIKAPSHLLKENGCDLKAAKFNLLLIKQGYLEERERDSSSGRKKKYKALTDAGKKYGENAINPHNQKEVQPLYYEDTFMELYNKVVLNLPG